MTIDAIEPGGTVWAKVTRITLLDPDGNIIPGTSVFVTDALMKATLTQVNESGDTGAIKDAAGNLSVWYQRGDIPKWFTVTLEMVYPDPQIEALLTGGAVFSDTSEPLGPPADALTATPEATGGVLAAGTYGYVYEQFSVFGRTTPSPVATATTTGATGSVVLSGFSFSEGALGAVVFGRAIGVPLELGTVANIGSQATSADSGDGDVESLSVTALTEPIPAGTQFQIEGDTNSPPVVFTAQETGAVGSTTLAVLPVDVPVSIAAAAINVVFVDTGYATPSGTVNASDLSGGPGAGLGAQSAPVGTVSGPKISLEFFMERIVDGHQATDYPYYWHALPGCEYFVVGARDVTNAELQAVYTGFAFPNPNWGGGPSGQFPFDTSEIHQWTVCGEDMVPDASYDAQSAGV